MTWGSTSSWGLSPEQMNHSNILQGVIVGIFDLSLFVKECEGVLSYIYLVSTIRCSALDTPKFKDLI